MPEKKKKPSENKTFLIVGAGASGLFAARALEKTGIPRKNIILLEKNSWIGGKCHTYNEPEDSALATEYGAALIAHNYQIVLDAIAEKKLPIEKVLPTKLDSMDFMKKYLSKDRWGRVVFSAEVLKELIRFEKLLRQYEHARDNCLPLPSGFELSFQEFATRNGLARLNDILRPVVTGFGYGAMQVCPAYAVFEYMGHTTIPAMQLLPSILHQGPFYAIKGGFQRLMEAIAKDYEVLTEADIQSIDRSNGVTVEFLHQNEVKQLKADYLILALSPLHWGKLGLSLTPTEELAVKQVTYYHYPVAICKLKGYLAHQEFFEHGLQPEGFGDLALITTRDGRVFPEDGRLCTAYINLPQEPTQPAPVIPSVEKWQFELSKVNNVEKVEIIDTHTWEDYMSMVPWEVRCRLEKEQFIHETGYANSIFSYEDVGCVANYITKLIANTFSPKPTKVYDNAVSTDLLRAYWLFKTPQHPPVHVVKKLMKKESSGENYLNEENKNDNRHTIN
ncbi:FAD-dependent oxidoreductase [Legionella jamestowniensis]|uniref:Tryptophan 2-monooxygenase n=1 Tax=Legionella jamestowniensis TaxID=455 RepID=A0A0W0UK66_9GAMM|nr:FAD-dependent oxidoreductase [Legionella jamestowniensis]KTD08299.1 protoporphyrinogen oxidase [Legionella jamestowniensis]SFL49441.1 Monoamine oxidase [Legionella jamestowniensis DSM 19215]